MLTLKSSGSWLFALAALLILAGCTDIRDYEGTWTGSIVTNPHQRKGFEAHTVITLEVDKIDRSRLVGRLTVAPSQSATEGFTAAPLVVVDRADNDALGDMSFDGDPLATYLFWLTPDDPLEEHALAIVSVHPKRHIQVRILRHDLYGVFRLER